MIVRAGRDLPKHCLVNDIATRAVDVKNSFSSGKSIIIWLGLSLHIFFPVRVGKSSPATVDPQPERVLTATFQLSTGIICIECRRRRRDGKGHQTKSPLRDTLMSVNVHMSGDEPHQRGTCENLCKTLSFAAPKNMFWDRMWRSEFSFFFGEGFSSHQPVEVMTLFGIQLTEC